MRYYTFLEVVQTVQDNVLVLFSIIGLFSINLLVRSLEVERGTQIAAILHPGHKNLRPTLDRNFATAHDTVTNYTDTKEGENYDWKKKDQADTPSQKYASHGVPKFSRPTCMLPVMFTFAIIVSVVSAQPTDAAPAQYDRAFQVGIVGSGIFLTLCSFILASRVQGPPLGLCHPWPLVALLAAYDRSAATYTTFF